MSKLMEKLVIIDDDTDWLDLLNDILSPHFRLILFEKYAEALEFLESNKDPIRGFIVDGGMTSGSRQRQQRDGEVVVEKIRNNELYNDSFTIGFTAVGEVKGADHQLPKDPFFTEKLLELVNSDRQIH